MAKKKAKTAKNNSFSMLTYLPESLQLHILSSKNAKYAVQTSVLSKSWLQMWTRVTVLQFDSVAFHNNLVSFDTFVHNFLRLRDQSVTLDRLTFNRHEACSTNMLKMHYAFSNGVKQAEFSIEDIEKNRNMNSSWPDFDSPKSLVSLKLQVCYRGIRCPYLGRRSESFKNLSVLYLGNVIISDPDPFSGFPVLKKLTLFDCRRDNTLDYLNIHALQLTDITIFSPWKDYCFEPCNLKTPKLRFFKYQGSNFGRIKTLDDHGLPVLETVAVDYFCVWEFEEYNARSRFEDLISFFRVFHNAKCLTLSSWMILVLKKFKHELVKQTFAFSQIESFED